MDFDDEAKGEILKMSLGAYSVFTVANVIMIGEKMAEIIRREMRGRLAAQ